MNIIRIGKDFDQENIVLEEDSQLFVLDCDKEISVSIVKNVRVFVFSSFANLRLHFEIAPYVCFSLDSFGYETNVDFLFSFGACSSLDYQYSCINHEDHFVHVCLDHEEIKTSSKVSVHCLNEKDGKMDIQIDTKMNQKSVDSKSSQESKIILLGKNRSKIQPNLLIQENSKMQVAHSAYLGKWKEEDLFYLASRGIKKEDAKRVLSKAFLLNGRDFTYDEKDLILKKLEEIWR